ncbi:hypothetical protein NDJ26_21170 [Vibrio parahaemolyticus]|uniref:hypothetical protein n=1 Tax=Vibrio parahaemolyticus TaxID=670 RepID=UPI00215F1CFC|nr:hypothetical protein [Vibrio parahaemolyticus]MCS0094439.1 hypothetical protein [Vibrio parahaemolyticus]
MKLIIISILVFSIGIVIGAWFGVNHVVVETETIPTKTFFELLSLSLSFGGFIFAGLSFAVAYHVLTKWKDQHKKECLTELKTDAIDRMLKSHTALSSFTFHKACKDTSLAFANAITDLQSVNMRYFSSVSSEKLQTIELMAFNITNEQMQFSKDYASFMSHFYNGAQRKCFCIEGRTIIFTESIEGAVRKGVLGSYLTKLGIDVEIVENKLDLQDLITQLYLAIIDNSGEFVAEAYSTEERI